MSSTKNNIHERLYFYVDKRDVKNVKKLLSDGANATKISSHGRTAIGHATFKGYAEVLQILLDSCQRCKYSCYDDASKAKKARTEPDLESTPDGMDGLQWDDEIQGGTTYANADDEWSRLYMYYAKMFEQTGELLANSLELQDPHSLDAFNQAPIHYAVARGQIECLNLLIQYGSPVDITTKYGLTPLHMAVKSEEVVRALLQHKSDPNCTTFSSGESALHTAAAIGKVRVVQLLLQSGANINAASHADRTPLMAAIQNENTETAICLINAGAKVNVQDRDGYTAIYLAVMKNDIRLTRHLLQNGARLFVTHYLLHACVRLDFLDMAKLLVASGENISVRDFSGCTPLFWAIKTCNAEMVEFLLDNGAERFERDVAKELHIAVQHAENVGQFRKVARVLFARGVSLNDYNYWYETPLMLAIMLEKFQIAEFLVKEGADVNKGRNPNTIKTMNFQLLPLLVQAGLNLQQKTDTTTKPPPWENISTNKDDFLAYHSHNALSLQSLSRIRIRNIIIDKSQKNPISHNNSRISSLIEQLEIPKVLKTYLSDFDDLPNI